MAEKLAFSTREAAAALDINEKTLRSAVAKGEVPHLRIGRLIKIPAWWLDEQRFGARVGKGVPT